METKTFRVYLTGTASAMVEVEVTLSTDADDLEFRDVAVDAALAKGVPSLCHHCSRHMEGPEDWDVRDMRTDVEEVK